MTQLVSGRGEAENHLKFVLGIPNSKIYATEGPLPKAADRALTLKSASAEPAQYIFKCFFKHKDKKVGGRRRKIKIFTKKSTKI